MVDSLPSEFPPSEAAPPEGDWHYLAKLSTRDALTRFFREKGRGVYIANELPVYYPDEPMFAPDLIVVLDVDPHEREKWVVAHEHKGLDFALEVHVAGDRRKDLERNVERFARLGIPEYFIFDRGRLRLTGWRLAAGSKSYQPIVPQAGRYASTRLGLDLVIEGSKLRFYDGSALLLEADEFIARLRESIDQLERRAAAAEAQAEMEARLREEETRRREEETRRREEETRRREEAERRAAELQAELERLKRQR